MEVEHIEKWHEAGFLAPGPQKAVTFIIQPEIAEMKQRLATSPLLLEAEQMGFEINIKLPFGSAVPTGTVDMYA